MSEITEERCFLCSLTLPEVIKCAAMLAGENSTRAVYCLAIRRELTKEYGIEELKEIVEDLKRVERKDEQ